MSNSDCELPSITSSPPLETKSEGHDPILAQQFRDLNMNKEVNSGVDQLQQQILSIDDFDYENSIVDDRQPDWLPEYINY